jgi:hypothetical protein
MRDTITITHQAVNSSREFCRLPVRYSIEQDALIDAPVVYCLIDVPREHIPSWLNPVSMERTYFCMDGMHMILYNVDSIDNADARAFCAKLYLAIMMTERQKISAGKTAESELLSFAA